MLFNKFLALSVFLLIFFSFTEAATTYPYTNIALRLPGCDDPYPGLGIGYSSLGEGIRTILWNPAGLAKIKISEGYLGATTAPPSSQWNKSFIMKDITFEVAGTSGTSASNFSANILYTNNLAVTGSSTREFIAYTVYTPSDSGADFKQAVKVADWLSVGISSRGETNASLALSGAFPIQYYSSLNLLNTTNFMGSGISVGSTGQLSYRFTPSVGASYTYTSEASVWSGFLNQSQRIPFSLSTEFRNNLNVQAPLTFTGAAKWGALSAGANLTPIAATLNVDNTAKAMVNEGAADPYSYTPNFNPNNEADVIQWMTDPNRYGTESGYRKKYLRVTAGQSIGEAKYTGFYQASTSRLDFGIMYDFKDTATVGIAFENINSAAINLKGTGRVAYVNSRVSSLEGAINLINPSTEAGWSPFSDVFSPLAGTENIGMLPEINFALPQRTKIGFTLRKPILITIDYETQNNSITYRYRNSSGGDSDAVISNFSIIRGGLETQLAFLPMRVRASTAMLLKPNASGLDATAQQTYNGAFFILKRLLPLSLDAGGDFDMWGYNIGGAFGVNAVPLFSLIQFDTLSINSNKILFYSISVNKDNWHVVLQNNLDPLASGMAYSNAPASEKIGSGWLKYLNFLKWTSTLTIGFNF